MPKDQLRAGSAEARASSMKSVSMVARCLKCPDLYPAVMAQLALKKGANSNAQISKDDCEMRIVARKGFHRLGRADEIVQSEADEGDCSTERTSGSIKQDE